DAVARGIVARRLERLRVDVYACRRARAEPERGDAENPGAAPIIKHDGGRRDVSFEPGEAEPRRRMATRAECGSGVEHDVDRLRIRWRVPGRYDPKPLAGAHRREL